MIHKQQLMSSTEPITIWIDDEKPRVTIVDENAENTWMTRLTEPRLNKFVFNFSDGEQAVFTNDKAGLKSMQDFLDLMNKTHILQKQLEIAKDALTFYSNDDIAAAARITLKQIEDLNK